MSTCSSRVDSISHLSTRMQTWLSFPEAWDTGIFPSYTVAALKDNSWDALLPLIIPGAEAVSTWILTLISIIFLFKLHWRLWILNCIFIFFQSRNADCVLIAQRATAIEPAEALKQYGPWCYCLQEGAPSAALLQGFRAFIASVCVCFVPAKSKKHTNLRIVPSYLRRGRKYEEKQTKALWIVTPKERCWQFFLSSVSTALLCFKL